MNCDRTRASLLLRIRDFQDQKSWDEFVDLYGPMIYRCLRRFSRISHAEAVELVQDALLIVVRKIGEFQYDPNRSFRGWLFTIAKNLGRRLSTRKAQGPDAPGGSNHKRAMDQFGDLDPAHDEIVEEEWRRRVEELAMKKIHDEFKEESWQVFHMRYFDGMSFDEIVERLGIKKGTAYTRYCRISKRLQQTVEEFDEYSCE